MNRGLAANTPDCVSSERALLELGPAVVASSRPSLKRPMPDGSEAAVHPACRPRNLPSLLRVFACS